MHEELRYTTYNIEMMQIVMAADSIKAMTAITIPASKQLG